MRKENFGAFLNDWGRSLARYGSSVPKFVEKGGRLIPVVTPWQRLIVDPIDFDSNPKIEVLEFTEAQLRQHKEYDQDMVEKLCSARQARTTLNKQKQDIKNDFIKLYEVHGVFPLSYLTGKKKDEDTYCQQMHVVSFLASSEKGKFNDFTLVSGREQKEPNMITHLIKEDGQTLSIGAVQHLFEAQWMMNHTVKSIKDQLDLASKLIFQTSDGNFVGQNALSAIETGDILIHALNQPISKVDNASHDITSLQNFGAQWKALSNEINGISESMLGKDAKSGTAWKQTKALLDESHSLFDVMTMNKEFYIQEMFRIYIFPFIKKKMNNSKQIVATLEAHAISQIDAMYIKNESTRRANKDILATVAKTGKVPSKSAQDKLTQAHASNIQQNLQNQNGERFFAPSDISSKTWKDIFKTIEDDLEVDIGQDDADKENLETLNTVLQTLASNPRVLLDPNMKLVFNKILTITGAVSPAELVQAQPFVIPPQKQFREVMDYQYVPEDIKRQMEEQQGFTPSQLPPPATAPGVPAAPSPLQPKSLPTNVVGGK